MFNELNDVELMNVDGGLGEIIGGMSAEDAYEGIKEAVTETVEFLKSDKLKDFLKGVVVGYLE